MAIQIYNYRSWRVSVGGIVVSIAAFQAVDPGSIPGQRIFVDFMLFLSVLNYKKFNTTGISPHNVQLFGFVTCCVVASSISTIGLERGGWVRLTNNIDRPTKPSLLLTKLINKLSGK